MYYIGLKYFDFINGFVQLNLIAIWQNTKDINMSMGIIYVKQSYHYLVWIQKLNIKFI